MIFKMILNALCSTVSHLMFTANETYNSQKEETKQNNE